nr:RNA-dependent RNA polymerase [ssRNA positive-strand virus sp.]
MAEKSGGEEKPDRIISKIDSEIPMDYDLRLNDLGKFFQLNDDITNEIFRQQLYSKEDNYLKDVVGGLLTEKLTNMVKKKSYVTSVNIEECLDTNQENIIIQAFPEFKLNFKRNRVNAHSLAAAFRKCETYLVLNKLQYDRELTMEKFSDGSCFIKDIGGNFLFHINNNNKNIHTCAPILSNYDQSRFTSRMYDISILSNNRKNLTESQIRMIRDIHKVVKNSNFITNTMCMKKGQNCNIKSKALMFIHSNYDVPLIDLADAMDMAEAEVAYGTFIFSPRILIEKTGFIEGLGVDFEYLEPSYIKNNNNKNYSEHYNKLRFSFRNDASYNYIHNTRIYYSYISVNMFFSRKGNVYNLELQENRNGIQIFKITKHLIKVNFKEKLTHKIYFDLQNKIRIKFFDLDSENLYNFTNKIYPNEKKKLIHYNDFAYYACALKEISFFADKDIVEKTVNFAIGVSESKFKPDELFNYIRSVCTRSIVANGVIRVNSDLTSIQMKALANAVYIYVYDLKYRFGKVTQQIIGDINWNRDYLDSSLFIKLFGPSRTNYLINNSNMFPSLHRILFKIFKVDISGDEFLKQPQLYKQFDQINKYSYKTYIKKKFFNEHDIHITTVEVDIPAEIDNECMVNFRLLARQIYKENFGLEIDVIKPFDDNDKAMAHYIKPKRNLWTKLVNKVWYNATEGETGYNFDTEVGEIANAVDENELIKDIQYTEVLSVEQKEIKLLEIIENIDSINSVNRQLNHLDVGENDYSMEVGRFLRLRHTVEYENAIDQTKEYKLSEIFDKFLNNRSYSKVLDLYANDGGYVQEYKNRAVEKIYYHLNNKLVMNNYKLQNAINSDFVDGDLNDEDDFEYIINILKDYNFKFDMISADGFNLYVKDVDNDNRRVLINQIYIIKEFLTFGGSFIMTVSPSGDSKYLDFLTQFLSLFKEYYIYRPSHSKFLNPEIILIGLDYGKECNSDLYNIKENLIDKFYLYSKLIKKNFLKILNDEFLPFEEKYFRKEVEYPKEIKESDNEISLNSSLSEDFETISNDNTSIIELKDISIEPIIYQENNDNDKITEILVNNNDNIVKITENSINDKDNNHVVSITNNNDDYEIECNGCIIKKFFVDIDKFEIKNSITKGNNCLFNSITEHRNVNLNEFRKFISNISDDNDVKNECTVNNMAGTMTIETFVKYYNVGVVSVDEDLCQVILPQQNVNPMRYIYIKFKNNHYDLLKIKCNGEKYSNLEYNNMFSPLLTSQHLEILKELIGYRYVEFLDFIESEINQDVIINNLQIYCLEHIECYNNNMIKLIKRFKNLKINNIVFFIEESNFSIELFDKYITNDYNLMYRFINIPFFKNYLIIQLRKTTRHNNLVLDVSSDILLLKNHKCNKPLKKNNRNINGQIINYCCYKKFNIIEVNTTPKYYDKIIIINKTDNLEKVDVYPNKYILNLKISVGCYKFTNEQISAVLKFLDVDDIVYIESNTVSLYDLLEGMKNKKLSTVYMYYKVEYNDDYYYPKFIMEQHDLDYRVNCVSEIIEVWRHTTRSIKNQLEILIREYTLNKGKSKDVSFGVIDFDNMCWKLKPAILYDSYEKVYYKGEFVEFNECYQNGKFQNIRNNFKGLGYLSKDTRLMLADKLYKRASSLKIDKLKVNKKLIIHNGAPGVGKTEFILNNHNTDIDMPINHIVLTNTRESAMDIRERAKKKYKFTDNVLKEKYRTGDSYLLNHFGEHSEVLWIDEGFMKHPGEWFLYGVIANAKEIHIMGDIAQIPYQERTGKNVHFGRYDKRLKATIKNMGVSYRCPLDIIYWLNLTNKYDFKVQGKSEVVHSVNIKRISGVNEINFCNYDHLIAFTQEEKLTIIKQADSEYKTKINTIHEYQGKQCNSIAIVRLINKANPIYDSDEHILVALSRHRIKLEYLTVSINDKLAKQINKIKNLSTPTIKEVIYSGGGIYTEKIVIPDSAVQIYTQPKFIQKIIMNHCYTGYVPYEFQLIDEYEYFLEDPEKYFCSPVNAINVLQDFIDRVQPQSSVDSNKYDHQQLHENPLLLLSENFYYSEMYAYNFNSRDYLSSHLRTPIQRAMVPSIRQLIKAFAERNGSVPNLQGTLNEFQQANLLFADFKKTYIDNDVIDMSECPLTINFSSIKSWLTTQPPSIRKILESFDNDFMLGNNLNRYNYILKRVAKIDTEIDAHLRYKSPQTIAFLDKLVNTIFCPLWRDIKSRLNFILKRNTFIYVDQSPLDFANKLSHNFSVHNFKHKYNKFLEIDFSKYDKSQKLIALLFETLIMKYFGVDSQLINIWIFLHIYTELHDYKLKFNAFVNYQRKSGDAATFIGNTIFLMAVIASVFELYNTNFYALYSGDDSLLFVDQRPSNLQNKVDKLAYLYNLEAKLLTFATPYFCSKFLIPSTDKWLFVPDTIKLINKLGRNDLVDYVHVEEYRISFLDNLHYYKNSFNYDMISEALNDRYNINGDHTIIYNALLYIVSDKKIFSKLYYLEDNAKLIIDPSRPSLDI